jgi:hypothetical protein
VARCRPRRRNSRALDELRGRGTLARLDDSDRLGEEGEHVGRREAPLGELRQGDGTVPLGQARTIRAEDEGNVPVCRCRQPEQPLQHDLPRRRGEQVVTADHLTDPLRRIVDHDGEVVRGDAVVATKNDVVGDATHLTADVVMDDDHLAVGTQANRRAPTFAPHRGRTSPRQVAAGPGVRTFCDQSAVGVRRAGGLADLASRAVALVGPAGCGEALDRRVVQIEALALAHDHAIMIDADAAERSQLGGLMSR